MTIFDLFFKKEEKAKRSTQAYLDIAQIKDSLIVLKNGGIRLVFMVSTTCFELKSEKEQDALIAQYQAFLNSLEFPIQILVHSRRVDLYPYLENFKRRLEEEENELLKKQMIDYLAFLAELVPQANIMDKKFYIIVPYDPVFLKPFSGTFSESEFQQYKKELLQRAEVVASGLASLGLRCIQLNTQELVELFYNIYNPELATEERLRQIEELIAPVIKGLKET